MHVSGNNNLRRDPRYQYSSLKRAEVRSDDGGGTGAAYGQTSKPQHDATVNDISASGASIRTSAKLATRQFIELSIDGLPPIAGNVVRAYNGVVAIEFSKDQESRQRLEREVQRLNRVA